MMLVMVAVRDAKTESFMAPQFWLSRGQAIRSFADAVNDRTTEFAKHPEDYAIFEFGTFNQLTGAIVLNTQMVELANAFNLQTRDK